MKEQISQMIQDVHDGNESACKVVAMLKDLQSVIDSGLKVIQQPALDEAREFNKDEVMYGGVWTVKNTPTYLDFSQDETFVNLNGQASARKKDLNAAWKAKQTGKGFFDSETGEELPILPVKTASKEYVTYTPKQN